MADLDQDFFARTEELAQMVGKGSLAGIFAVDGGARTESLEVGTWRTGPNAGVRIRNWSGGDNPHAILKSFTETYELSLADIAKTTLESGPQEAMQRHVENVNKKFKDKAPEVTGSYKDSTARIVEDNGIRIHEEYGGHWGQDPASLGARNSPRGNS